MPQNTGESEWLIQQFTHGSSRSIPKDVPRIKLNQLVSKLSLFYEKLRNAIDYHDEHLIRRNSLKRLLNRQVKFLAERDPQKISRTIIFEFIRARYLPNDALPESDIERLSLIVAKYLTLLNFAEQNPLPEKAAAMEWLLELMVCEVDEALFDNSRDLAIVNFMYGEMIKSISFVKNNTDLQERNLQIYIAVLKTLIKADPALIRYFLLKLHRPDWNQLSPEGVLAVAPELIDLRNKIEAQLLNRSGYQLALMMRAQAVFFTILRQLIEQEPQTIKEIIADEQKLAAKITEICNKNYKKTRGKLAGSIVRVIIYIFFTKTILAFILELPYDQIIVRQVNWTALLINIIFHPLLMTAIAASIRVPGDKNTELIVEETKKIIYGEERKLVFKPRRIMRLGSFSFWFFHAIYLIMFGISFGIIIWALNRLHFNIISGALFIFFLTLISFFGFRLRNVANQYLVLPRKENLFNFLVDFFTLPIIRAGKLFSENFSRINIFVYILDFAIETPFKMLVELLEQALSFIGEKREEIS
jgi:ABC-type multidrug transport system fused ATPase/permease subunit